MAVITSFLCALQEPILSRFDILCVVRDTVDPVSHGLTAAVPTDDPYCSCRLTRCSAYSCSPYG